MRFIVGVIAGASLAAGAIMMTDPAYMKKMKKRCRCAKRMIQDIM